jgi:hypothetical protein
MGEGWLLEGQTLVCHHELGEALSHFVGANQREVELALVHEGLILLERQVLGAPPRTRRRLEEQCFVDVQSELFDDDVVGSV